VDPYIHSHLRLHGVVLNYLHIGTTLSLLVLLLYFQSLSSPVFQWLNIYDNIYFRLNANGAKKAKHSADKNMQTGAM
jgi:hypothetical protein